MKLNRIFYWSGSSMQRGPTCIDSVTVTSGSWSWGLCLAIQPLPALRTHPVARHIGGTPLSRLVHAFRRERNKRCHVNDKWVGQIVPRRLSVGSRQDSPDYTLRNTCVRIVRAILTCLGPAEIKVPAGWHCFLYVSPLTNWPSVYASAHSATVCNTHNGCNSWPLYARWADQWACFG